MEDYKLIYAPLTHWVGRGPGTPKDKDEVNKREVCECVFFFFSFFPSIFLFLKKEPMASSRWMENGEKVKAKLEAAGLPPDLLLHIFSHQTPSSKILNFYFSHLVLSMIGLETKSLVKIGIFPFPLLLCFVNNISRM